MNRARPVNRYCTPYSVQRGGSHHCLCNVHRGGGGAKIAPVPRVYGGTDVVATCVGDTRIEATRIEATRAEATRIGLLVPVAVAVLMVVRVVVVMG